MVAGEQNGNTWTYRYLGADLPRTLMDISAEKKKDKHGEEYTEITKIVSSSTVGGLDDNQRVTTIKTVRRGSEDFEEAVRIANF